MKNGIVIVTLFVAAVSLIAGCGTQEAATTTTTTSTATTTTTTATGSTTTTSTTTTTLSGAAKAGSAAKDVVAASVGVSNTSSTIGDAANPTIPSASGLSIASKVVVFTEPSPPSSFFDPLSTTGWMTIEGEGMVSGETVQIRLYTRRGDLINSALLADKKVASFEGFSWRSIMSGGLSESTFTAFATSVVNWINYSADWDPANAAKRAAFYANSSKYYTCSSLGDYIAWSQIAMDSGLRSAIGDAYQLATQGPPLAAYPAIGTPEASSLDEMGTQEAHVTGTHPDGSVIDLTMSVSTDATGRPSSTSGSGTMTRPDGTIMTINAMSMNFDGTGNPSSGTMDITIGSPDYLHMVMTMYASGSAEGTVASTATTPETALGTVVIFASADTDGHYGYFLPTGSSTREYF